MSVDLLCSDSWACNSGDVATALVTANELAERGIAVSRVAESRGRPTIIGGGHLFRPREAANAHIYSDAVGPVAINAAGADPGTAWPADVRFASFRDRQSAELYSGHAELVPCPSVLIRPLDWRVACGVPRFAPLALLRKRGFIVVHARPELAGIANATAAPLVAIEPAPYTWHPWEAAGWLMPATHSPELVAAVIANARAVITMSLHMSIFALAVGTPFAVIDAGTPQTDKVRRYWERAGFAEVMHQGSRPLAHALGIDTQQFAYIRRKERGAARSHLDRLAQWCAAGSR